MKASQLTFTLITFLILTTSGLTKAQSPFTDEVIRHVLAGETVPPRLLIKAADERSQAQKKQDDTLHMLLTLPFEQRQYVFPAIFESNLIPQKIRTHPEIAIWKGKMPTDIAPEMQDFAQKYLADLNPRLYMFLAPKSLPFQQPDSALNGNINWQSMLRKMKPLPTPNTDDSKGYSRLQSLLSLSPEYQKNYKKSTLSTSDIQQTEIGFQKIADFLKAQPDKDKFDRSLSLLRTFATDPDEDKINPFQSQIARIRMMGRGTELDTFFQETDFKNADVFAQKADTILKAYRAYHLDIPTALLYHKIRGANKLSLNDTERIIYVQSHMHKATPGDVYFIQSHLSDIKQMFQKAGYRHLLDPMMIDESMKIEYNVVPNDKE